LALQERAETLKNVPIMIYGWNEVRMEAIVFLGDPGIFLEICYVPPQLPCLVLERIVPKRMRCHPRFDGL
jgi:hypothetical protein